MSTHTVLGYTEAKVRSKTCGYVRVTIIDVSGSFDDDYNESGSHILVEHIEVAKLLMPVTAGRNGITFYPGGQPDIWGNAAEIIYLQSPGKVELRPRTADGELFDLLTNDVNNTGIGFPGFLRDENGKYYPLWDSFYAIGLPYLDVPITEFDYGYYHNPDSVNELTYSRLSTDISAFQRRLTWANDAMWGAIVGDETDPYAGIDGESPIPGGVSIHIPGLPPASATSTGLVGLFSPTPQEMSQFADFMWTDFGGAGTSVEDVLGEIVEAIKRLISNPLSYVYGLNIIPSQGLSLGAGQDVRFGFISSGVNMARLTSQYFIVNCGTLQFDTVCGNTFLDYAPYSKFQIYLPYIGFREVDANDFVGHTIGVVYHGDVLSGAVTAYITKDGSVMYQYAGSCAVNVPLSSDNFGQTITSAISVASTIVGGAASGGIAGAASGGSAIKGALGGLASNAANAATNLSQLAPPVAHSGSISGTAGAMGIQKPFIIREAVRFHSTSRFNTVSGYPLHYYKLLGSMAGYTQVLDINLENITATADEMDEIKTLLQGGVIL